MGRKEPDRKQDEETKRSRWGFRGKTVWDWMALLIVPLVLVVIGLVFTMLQDARQQDLENQRAQQAQKIEDQRAEAERELAEQRAQDEALQAYLDQMTQLILDRKLLEAEQGDPVHTLAQARTSTVILRLDAKHNESVIRFLSDSGLAVSSETSAGLLGDITLSRATLSDAFLPNADLSEANLSGADLSHADLSGADLSGAHLSGADLSYAYLRKANLSDANLPNADLSGALLGETDLSDAYLRGANLSGADLSEAKLRGAFLYDADLSGALLGETDLSDAYLEQADFSCVLSRVLCITNEELEQQAASLKGATMPNGQKYEDWLKSKGSEENGQNDGLRVRDEDEH